MDTINVKEFGFAVAIGVALVGSLIWSSRKQQAFLQNLVENHLAHNTAAIQALTEAISVLNGWLREQRK